MLGSGLALAAGLAALLASRVRGGVRGWASATAWALAACVLAWVVGYAALVRGRDLGLLAGVPTVRPLALGGWAGGALALAGALTAWTRPRRPDADGDRAS